MKRILSLVLAPLMLLSLVSCKDAAEETVAKQIAPEEVSGFFEEVTLPQNGNSDPALPSKPTVPSTPTDSTDPELPSEGPDVEMTQQDALSGFSIKEKRFTYEYKGYILFDVTNETDRNYNLTVHAKYFDAEGKKLDETWEIYTDFAAGHQQYILLDPEIRFAECQYDFQVKETESDCWRSKVNINPKGMVVNTYAKNSVLLMEFEIKNNALRVIYVKCKVLFFDSNGETCIVRETGNLKQYPSKNADLMQIILDVGSKDELEVPEDLKDGYTAIAVIESITEE